MRRSERTASPGAGKRGEDTEGAHPCAEDAGGVALDAERGDRDGGSVRRGLRSFGSISGWTRRLAPRKRLLRALLRQFVGAVATSKLEASFAVLDARRPQPCSGARPAGERLTTPPGGRCLTCGGCGPTSPARPWGLRRHRCWAARCPPCASQGRDAPSGTARTVASIPRRR